MLVQYSYWLSFAALLCNAQPGQYIVTLDSAADRASHLAWVEDLCASISPQSDESCVGRNFEFPGFNAYTVALEEDSIELISQREEVIAVEFDAIIEDLSQAITEQHSAPWGLSAISHNHPAPDDPTYVYDDIAGADTFAYILDSGIYAEHIDFEGRAVMGYNAAIGSPNTDTGGHGTHVAGIIGGRIHGVAKATSMIGVKVTADGLGQVSWMLDGLAWTMNDIIANNRTGKAIVNRSNNSFASASTTQNLATQALIDNGVPVICSAGNSNANATAWAPGNLPQTINVAASDVDYQRWTPSNWGVSVDIFAPGSGIVSAWIGSANATATQSGTSMASPHVAGVSLYLMAKEGLRTPAEIWSRLEELALRDVILDVKGSPNLFLNNGNKS